MVNIWKVHNVTFFLSRTPIRRLATRVSSARTNEEVRVRFAPSPTGYLHLGGLRTALYNYLFARSHNGKFILRIEDTDQTRVVNGASKQLQNDLTWAGIAIDEGPIHGGEFGPYVQSERLEIYKRNVQTLLDNGSAYHCFCTDKRLDLLRKDALRSRQIPKYDNRCRQMGEDEVRKRLGRGEKYCIRFKLLPDCETFEDMIYGNIAFDVALHEGDPVIVKSDGYPTYHFANVVDDHYMQISHVLRGVEWQISTTKHILMYRAFDWEPPRYGHLPLLINSDGTKLSKRQGDIQISRYREAGIYPLALMNFITSSGGGFEKDSCGAVKAKIYTIQELTQQFNVKQINAHSGKLDSERLKEFNRLELTRLLNSDSNKLINDLRLLIKEHFKNVEFEHLQTDSNYIKAILIWALTRINRLDDLLTKDFSFLWVLPNLNQIRTSVSNDDITSAEALRKFISNDEQPYDSKDAINKTLRKFAEDNHIKYSKFMKLLRNILSGLQEGPSVAEMMAILGKDNTIDRLDNFLNKTRPMS